MHRIAFCTRGGLRFPPRSNPSDCIFQEFPGEHVPREHGSTLSIFPIENVPLSKSDDFSHTVDKTFVFG